MEGYDASTYGDRFAEVYDDWYGDVTDAEACADHLAARAAGRAVLELGVGSGRIAIPLTQRGVEVHGVDASEAMVAQLRSKPGGERVTVTVADMAELAQPAGAPFGVVFVAFNTFFNLPSEQAQERCLTRVAELLAPEGCFIIEAFVPLDDAEPSAPGSSVTPRRITADEVVLTVSLVDPDAQTITGQHVHLRESGVRLRPWHLRYATPAQLDTMAARCGLELEARHAGWSGEVFGPDSSVHVSTYRRTNVRSVREHPPATQR